MLLEDVKNTGLGALDAHLTGLTKEILDIGLGVGGIAAAEGLLTKGDVVAVAQLTLLQQTIDAHLAAYGA